MTGSDFCRTLKIPHHTLLYIYVNSNSIVITHVLCQQVMANMFCIVVTGWSVGLVFMTLFFTYFVADGRYSPQIFRPSLILAGYQPMRSSILPRNKTTKKEDIMAFKLHLLCGGRPLRPANFPAIVNLC